MSKQSTNETNQGSHETKQTKLIASRLQDISNEFDKFVSSDHPAESSEIKHLKQVRKRDGTLQPVSFDKIRDRIMNLSDDLDVDSTELSQEVISCLFDGIETKELDELAARKAHNRCFIHPDWDKLASRISISNHHKETSGVFSEVIFELYKNNLVCKEVVDFVKKYETRLNDVIDYKRDYALDYTGFQYFLKIYADRTIQYDDNGNEIQGPIIERFQDLLMKVSLGIHRGGFDIDSAIETYQFYSCLLFTHASPTIFNAAKTKSQCSSCFLLAMKEEPEWPYDSITKIYETLSDCAKISKLAGGIGVSMSNVRGKGTIIHSVGRPSSGIVPMCKVYNETARYVDQGRRRKGAFACFCADTEIITVNGGVKKIKDVQIGDLVVTHKNRIKPVAQVHKNLLGNRKIYKLVVERNKDIYVTGNHKFWSFYTKKYKDNQLSLGWNSIDELKNLLDNPKTTRQSCYISIPEGTGIENLKTKQINVLDYKYILEDETHTLRELDHNKILRITQSIKKDSSNDISHSQSINKVWNITEDLCNLFGIWLGDGHIRRRDSNGPIIGIGITIHMDNKEEIDFVKKICEESFGCNITEYTSKTSKVTNITVNSSMIGSIFHELFGSHFDGKRLPEMCFGWPKSFVESLMSGLITSDGHIAKTKCNATLGMSNEKIMTQLYHLCRINGIAVSFVKGKAGKGMTCDPYSMSIPLNKKILSQTRKLYADDRIERCHKILNDEKNIEKNFLKILDIVETDKTDEYVYTLGVQDDHSYTVEGLLAENCYLEPWHPDIVDFLQLKKDDGVSEDLRAKDLFYAMWIPDLFMKRVKANEIWSLIDPSVCPELYKTNSEEFEEHYLRCEREKKYVRQMPAKDLYYEIIVAQIETGTPYMLFKDHVNRKSNQKNLGTIRQSNLCAEICEYTDSNEQAVCNLCSICLPRYIDVDGDGNNPTFNHDLLYESTKILTRNLNKVIDINYYPNDETKRSNFLHRPIGIGIQGLADTFYKMGYPYESKEAAKLNSEISETIYFAALEASCELAEEEGAYESYEGSPMSKGIFQFDLWNDSSVSDRWNWTELKESIAVHGVRNSLLVALMPTASTSFLMGCCESFEPISSNYYVSGGIVGSFKRVNKYLIHEMIDRGLWSNEMRNLIVANNGSVQNIGLPKDIEKLYKTVWEIPQKVLIDLSAERGRFTCQSQSFNVYLLGAKENQSGNSALDQSIVSKLSSLHMYTWEKGLKTGMYYLRTKPAKDPIKTTIDPKMMRERQQANLVKDVDEMDENDLEEQAAICRRDNKEDCMMCGA
jgi:ribonucleoside-diphosphate reductase alpha subunit